MAPQHGRTAGLTRLYCYKILDPVRPWLYPKSCTRVCPCRNEHKTQSGELARGKGTAHLHQTTFHYS